MSLSSSGSSKTLAPSLVGGIGGLLAVIGFFLPWYALISSGQQFNPSSPDYTSISGWNLTNQYLTGTRIGAPNGTIAGPMILPLAFITALPLIMGLVALVANIIGISLKPSALISGLTIAAGIVGIFGLNNTSLLSSIEVQLLGSGSFPSNYPGTSGLGIAFVYLGLFGVLAGGFAGFMRQPQTSPAQEGLMRQPPETPAP